MSGTRMRGPCRQRAETSWDSQKIRETGTYRRIYLMRTCYLWELGCPRSWMAIHGCLKAGIPCIAPSVVEKPWSDTANLLCRRSHAAPKQGKAVKPPRRVTRCNCLWLATLHINGGFHELV